MMDGFGGHGWGMGWGWIIGLIVLVVIVWVIVKAVNQNNPPPDKTGQQSALDILKERYARGEISQEEFEKRKKDLI